jgi:hypothetical protein
MSIQDLVRINGPTLEKFRELTDQQIENYLHSIQGDGAATNLLKWEKERRKRERSKDKVPS